jgi:hypothetical protein
LVHRHVGTRGDWQQQLKILALPVLLPHNLLLLVLLTQKSL